MSLLGIYALWKRELVRFYRERSRLIGARGESCMAVPGSGLKENR